MSGALPPILLVGAGRMGGALFAGWCARGLAPSVLVDPSHPGGVARDGVDKLVGLAAEIPAGFAPAAVVLAIKPQMAEAVLPDLAARIPQDAVVLSILAGKTIAGLSGFLGRAAPMVRAMPNTPAAIGQGMTGAFAGEGVSEAQKALCDALLSAVGEVVWLEREALIDPLTAISGSGPAYVFLLAEILEEAGVERGLSPSLARQLARKTVFGAGALLAASAEDAADLRRAVTSPNGTTQRALEVLMRADAWPKVLREAVVAAETRARELAR